MFALFVIITHSYNLIDLSIVDAMARLTKGQMTFSHLGVCGFFSISGFLIFKSLQRSPNILDYLKKRVLRLFPALAVVLILTLALGAVLTTLSLKEYLKSPLTFSYFPANFTLYRLQDMLPGVFANNPYPNAINGSLWTLPYEFGCYLLLLLLFFWRTNTNVLKITMPVLMVFLLVVKYIYGETINNINFFLLGRYILEFGGFFAMGSLLAVYQQWILPKHKMFAFFSIALLIASIYLNFFDAISFVILPTVIVLLGLFNTPIINNVSKKIGDLSYGIYIFAFPVQQTLIYYGVLNPHLLMIFTASIVFVLAYFSWHLVEKQFLKLK